MKKDIQKYAHIVDAEVIDTWRSPDRVSLTRAELRQMQYNKTGMNLLLSGVGMMFAVAALWLLTTAFSKPPVLLPNCESNCSIEQGSIF